VLFEPKLGYWLVKPYRNRLSDLSYYFHPCKEEPVEIGRAIRAIFGFTESFDYDSPPPARPLSEWELPLLPRRAEVRATERAIHVLCQAKAYPHELGLRYIDPIYTLGREADAQEIGVAALAAMNAARRDWTSDIPIFENGGESQKRWKATIKGLGYRSLSDFEEYSLKISLEWEGDVVSVQPRGLSREMTPRYERMRREVPPEILPLGRMILDRLKWLEKKPW